MISGMGLGCGAAGGSGCSLRERPRAQGGNVIVVDTKQESSPSARTFCNQTSVISETSRNCSNNSDSINIFSANDGSISNCKNSINNNNNNNESCFDFCFSYKQQQSSEDFQEHPPPRQCLQNELPFASRTNPVVYSGQVDTGVATAVGAGATSFCELGSYALDGATAAFAAAGLPARTCQPDLYDHSSNSNNTEWSVISSNSYNENSLRGDNEAGLSLSHKAGGRTSTANATVAAEIAGIVSSTTIIVDATVNPGCGSEKHRNSATSSIVNRSGGCEQVRLTCEGSLSEANFPIKLNRIIRNLKHLLLPKQSSSYTTRGKFNVCVSPSFFCWNTVVCLTLLSPQ